MTRKTFRLGQVVATPGALQTFALVEEEYLPYLMRHANGDWGVVSEEDARLNDEALVEGSRLLSAYRLPDGTKVWIITEADRSSTCLSFRRSIESIAPREPWGVLMLIGKGSQEFHFSRRVYSRESL